MIKILHTSDWHLGQHFMGQSRYAEHQQFLDWLVQTAQAQEVSAIIVAGDIFDTGAPPSYARELYNQFVVALEATQIHLVLVGGNHDSVATLNESAALLKRLGAHVIPGVMATAQEQMIELSDPAGMPQLLVCAVPFLRPRDITTSVSGASGKAKQRQLQEAISAHYQAVYECAKTRQAEILKAQGIEVPIIATGHLSTVGAKTSDSVRDIYIGTLESLPVNAFPPADYIALGHIHRMQKVGASEHIRYCGSPIPLSFDELNSKKVVLEVTFDPASKGDSQTKEPDPEACEQKESASSIQITPIAVPCFQPMFRVNGSLNELADKLEKVATKCSPDLPGWVEISVSAEGYVSDLQQRIQAMVAELPLEILLIRRAKTVQKSLVTQAKETLDELTPTDVFTRRLSQEELSDEQRSRLLATFEQVVVAVETEDDVDSAPKAGVTQ